MLEINNLTFQYFGYAPVLHEVNFSCSEGVNVLFSNEKGGKTTLLKCIADVNESEGCFYQGLPIKEFSAKHSMVMLFDDLAIFKHRSVYYNLSYPLKLRKLPKEEIDGRIKSVIKKVGLSEYDFKEKPSRLPLVCSVKIAIARLLLRDAELYLIDNILCNLRWAERKEMFVLLSSVMQNLKGVVLYATDSIDEVYALNSFTVFLNYGYLIGQGNPYELKKEPQSLAMLKAFYPFDNFFEVQVEDEGKVTILGKEMSFQALKRFVGASLVAVVPITAFDFCASDGIEAEKRSSLYVNGEELTAFCTAHEGTIIFAQTDGFSIAVNERVKNIVIKQDEVLFFDLSSEMRLC